MLENDQLFRGIKSRLRNGCKFCQIIANYVYMYIRVCLLVKNITGSYTLMHEEGGIRYVNTNISNRPLKMLIIYFNKCTV